MNYLSPSIAIAVASVWEDMGEGGSRIETGHTIVYLFLVSEKEIKQWHKGFLKDCPNGLLTEQVRTIT